MTREEYMDHDMFLLDEIMFYQAKNAEYEKEIAINNVQIMELEKKRLEIRKEYEKPAPQRNLQGEIIKKEAA